MLSAQATDSVAEPQDNVSPVPFSYVRILIISPHERQSHWTLRFIEDSFCSRKFRIQLDGIGFFFPKKQELGFREGQNAEQRIDFDSEFDLNFDVDFGFDVEIDIRLLDGKLY